MSASLEHHTIHWHSCVGGNGFPYTGSAGSLSISQCEPIFSSKRTQKYTTADESVASHRISVVQDVLVLYPSQLYVCVNGYIPDWLWNVIIKQRIYDF